MRRKFILPVFLFLTHSPLAFAQGTDLREEQVGALSFGLSYNMDAGASVSGRFQHSRLFGGNSRVDFGFDVSEDEQSYDLLFQSEAFGSGNPKLAFVLEHATADLQSLMGIGTTKTKFRPQAVFAFDEKTLTVEAIFGRDEVTAFAAAPAVLLAEAGSRDIYGMGVDLTGRWDALTYGVSGTLVTDGGGLTYGKIETEAAYRFPTQSEDMAFEARFAAGMISVFDGQTTINDRFLPSSGVLRGFEMGGFGPSDPAALGGAPVGSTNYAVMSLDYRRTGLIAAAPQVAIGGFIDVGSSWGLDDNGNADRAAIDDAARLRASAGLTISRDFGSARVELVLSHPLQHQPTDRLRNVQIAFASKF